MLFGLSLPLFSSVSSKSSTAAKGNTPDQDMDKEGTAHNQESREQDDEGHVEPGIELADNARPEEADRSREQTSEGEDDIVIRIRDLKKGFSGKQILDGLSVDLRRGQNLAVMGKSGTGKSVLIKCIVRLLDPDSGSIEVFGEDMSDKNDRQVDDMRLRMGFLFQSGALYDSMSVRENMEFPLRRHKRHLSNDEINQEVEAVLKSVGLSHAIDKMPAELSGGMRKRAGLARTLILKPEIMLYDEPTTGLDTATSHEISELINSVRDEYNVSSIIITHDLPCAETCADQVMILKEGKNGAQGTYDELFNSDDPFVRSLFHPGA